MEPDRLLAELDGVLPGFAGYCRSAENLFDYGTLHGMFAACSHFVQEYPINAAQWPALADLLNGIVAGSDIAASEAACTCFLENLADPSHPLKAFLEGEALQHWKEWEPAG